MDQLTSAAANAPQLLQSAAAALAGTGSAATAPALPVTPPPAASASVTVPQPTLPGVPGVAEITKQPGVVPATTPSVPLPTAEATLPQVPGSPVPVPQQVTLPTDLAALLPAGVPLTNLVPANPPGATPGAPSLPSLLPVSALP